MIIAAWGKGDGGCIWLNAGKKRRVQNTKTQIFKNRVLFTEEKRCNDMFQFYSIIVTILKEDRQFIANCLLIMLCNQL